MQQNSSLLHDPAGDKTGNNSVKNTVKKQLLQSHLQLPTVHLLLRIGTEKESNVSK